MQRIGIIGSGFSSLSSASYLAKAGFDVTVFEQNSQLGGRARTLEHEGFTFDLGPSWYWMPDVFERFFGDFQKKPSDYYDLVRLNPGYRVYFEDSSYVEIPDNEDDIYALFEELEKGSSKKLKSFLEEAENNYNVAIKDLVYKPGVSPLELVSMETIQNVWQFFSTIRQRVRKVFTNEKIIKILEFPVLFLGAKPQNTPAFYSFMNYADFVLGTWYPMGGMGKVVDGMVSLAKEQGVKFETNAKIQGINVIDNHASSLIVNGQNRYFDIILSGADYHHTESLLEAPYRMYSEKYWEKKTFAPSALLFYVGFDKKLKGINHHTLFFDESFDAHAEEIYDNQQWPKSPLFYASFTSVTDSGVAPEGKENAVFLIPLAPDLKDSEDIRDQYFDKILERLEKHTNQKLADSVLFKKSYCVNDFKKDYNAYKGNAYGMANTLMQTAFLRPKIQSQKVKGLFFTGQLTVPGPGVPPALISGKIASDQIIKYSHKNINHGAVV